MLDETIEELAIEARNLSKESLAVGSFSKENVEDLRLRVAMCRMRLVQDALYPTARLRSAAELNMDISEGRLFKTYYLIAKSKKDEESKKNLYTASISESIARKAVKSEGTDYNIAKKDYLKYKDDESMLYQLVKTMDQVGNALSSIVK